MDNPNLTPPPRRPGWLRFLFGLIFTGLALLTLAALVVTAEGCRGTRKWNAYKKELEAKGEVLDLMAMKPKPVPDERNFAKHPLIAGLFINVAPPGGDFQAQTALPRAGGVDLEHDKSANGPTKSKNDTRTLLQMWSEYYVGHTNFPQAPAGSPPALVVRTALGKHDADLQALKDAMAARPECLYPLRYEDGMALLLPHLANMKGFAITLQLRAIANLHLGKTEEAFTDVRLGFFMADTVQADPILISHLVRIAMDSILLDAVKEGLCLRRWNDAQLAWFTGYLGKRDYMADHQAAMRTERAFGLHSADLFRQGRVREAMGEEGSGGERAAAKFLPSGIWRHNMYYIAWLHQEHTLPAVSPAERRVDRAKVDNFDQVFAKLGPSPYTIFARLLLPAVGNTAKHTARWQSFGDATMLACAAERHRLATGQLPARLEDLAPKYLPFVPRDAVSGKPLTYRVESPEHYLIYSWGWNDQDDGGKVMVKRVEGDWGVEIKPAGR